ncbi:glycoside hydrolase family 2 TIM barrel-domain containing protein [Flavobacterium aquicola]|uniref:Beta-galactosidase n=1 Tax=Flavobacterium aquicola TaxID=1682742 RepID=A0A3E0EQM3_9FLAO|nr:glycoside hydrolase family 2 TIM barrel-domain containing protein [Flavobacterium aquicola]REG99456.1 beta-galactosidase [Flavobacterium aquicola]
MNKFLIFIYTYCNILVCLTSYSQNQKSSQLKQKFDYGWTFELGDNSKASAENFDDSGWRKLDLPHDWSVEGNIDLKNPMGNDGGYFPSGIGWYRKSFELPAFYQNKKLTLYFEGVYMNSEVFINGVSVGVWPYGFSTFYYDITPYIKPGQKNVVAVRVDNSQQKNCRWYTGSGIYRHVWLLTTDSVHINPWGIAVTTPEADTEKCNVKIATVLKNESKSDQALSVRTKILHKGRLIASNFQKIVVKAQNEKEVQQTILLKNPKLWSPQSPELYQAEVTVFNDKKEVDKQEVAFGVRTIGYSAENGFLLNGEEIKINGGCVHHDNGSLGAASYDRAEYKKAEALKAAGFNAVRTSHNPPSEAFLDACDKIGLLVMDEAFDGWREAKNKYDYSIYFDKWWQKDIEAMVLRDRNHPSIVFWSIGNEIIERKKPEAIETAKKLAGLIRKIDSSRPVTSAMTTWDKDWEIFDPLFEVHDIGGYNYQMHHAAEDHKRVPSRVILQTESYPRDAFTNWKAVHDNKYIIGDFVWTAIDYLGESGIGRYFYKGETEGEHYERDIFPWHGAYCGDIDLTGWRKPISHYRDLLYNENKKLYMAVKEPNGYFGEIKETLWSVWPTWESWNWPGHEGKNIEVEVYSRYQSVRLYLNGTLIGEQFTTEKEQFKAVFSIPFTNGEIKAVGVNDGKEIESAFLKTSGKASKISLKADHYKINADGQDLSYITIEITDENGIKEPNAENELSFEIEGPGTIAAVDNANLQDTNSYVLNKRKAWKGRAIIIIKSTRDKGIIKLKVKSADLKPQTLEIVTK